MARRPYLIVGPCGTGKTKLALQFLLDGARRGEKVLLVTLEDPPNEMRINHRAMAPDLESIYVFDAIPDVMRYERAPFKDIAAVRSSVLFRQVAPEIRKTAELVSVEVTFSALEQTLKMEMARQNYTRLVVDSLTALQYFCMKGIDETQGAQSFLRFLSDLRITSLLTVEAPVEEIESAERLLARGEIRLFRWELEGVTVRAIGVEKFRGSAHDNRLHPYRISPTGLDIDLATTISRDTRRVVDGSEATTASAVRAIPALPGALDQILADLRDLSAVGIDVSAAQAEIAEGRVAAQALKPDEFAVHLIRARAIMSELAQQWDPRNVPAVAASQSSASERVVRIATEAADIRVGAMPPITLATDAAAGGLATGPGSEAAAKLDAADVAPNPPSPAESLPSAPGGAPPESIPAAVPASSGSSVTHSGPAGADPGLSAKPIAPLPSPSETALPPPTSNAARPSPPSPHPGPSEASSGGMISVPADAPHPPLPGTSPQSSEIPATEDVVPPAVLPEVARPEETSVARGRALEEVRPSVRPPLPKIPRGKRGKAPAEPPPSPEAPVLVSPPIPAGPTEATPTPIEPRAGPFPDSESPPGPSPAGRTSTNVADVPTSEPSPVPPEVVPPTRPKRRASPRKSSKSSTAADGTTKPKRRTASRRSAPPVTGAAPGTPPPDLASTPPPTPPAESESSKVPPSKEPDAERTDDAAPVPSKGAEPT